MDDSIYQQTITVGNKIFSYDELIAHSNLMSLSIDLANKYLVRYTDSKKAAKHLLHSSLLKSAVGGLSDLIPPDEKSNSVKYRTEFTFTLYQILLSLAIAYLAGFDLHGKEVWGFVLGNFRTVTINISSTEELSERVGYALAHSIFNITSSEVIGHRAYDFFFLGKRNSKRYQQYINSHSQA